MKQDLHLVDLGEVSVDTTGSVSTGKFEILVGNDSPGASVAQGSAGPTDKTESGVDHAR
jgi:hypothetical protein